MQITDHSSSGVTAKSIQLANLAFNFHHPDSPSFSYNKTQAHSPQQYRISINPENYPSHTTSDCLLQRNGYSIHLVSSLKQRIKAITLIKSMYASRGYQTDNACAFTNAPNQYTFEARQSQQLIGTMTLTIDTHDKLLADTLYRTELNQFRQRNRRLCELSKLAFNSESSSKEIYASLFHIAYIFARNIHNVDDAFIEINPRHAAFYKRMLGFQQIGELRTCPRVNAPAVLLHLNRVYAEQKIIAMAGQLKQKEKSIYPYFLSQNQEKEITQRVQTKYTPTTFSPSYQSTSDYRQNHYQPA